MRRSVRVAAAVAAAALAAAACSGAPKSGQSSAPLEKTNLVVAAVPALDSAALYIAQQRGLFTQQGLHVKIVPAISGATVIKQQMAGQYDVTLGNYVSYILANVHQHGDFRILAAASIMAPDTQVLVVPNGSPIQKISQLKGKTIGVNVPNNIGTLLVSSTLRDNAMSVKDVHFKSIDFPHMAAKLQAGAVDAAWVPEPFISMSEMTVGAHLLADMDQGSTRDLPIAGFLVTQKWLDKYPRTAAAFRRALMEGQRIAGQNLDAVKAGVEAYAKVPKSVGAVVAADQYPMTTDRRSIQRLADLMLQFGLLTKPYNVKPMIPPGT